MASNYALILCNEDGVELAEFIRHSEVVEKTDLDNKHTLSFKVPIEKYDNHAWELIDDDYIVRLKDVGIGKEYRSTISSVDNNALTITIPNTTDITDFNPSSISGTTSSATSNTLTVQTSHQTMTSEYYAGGQVEITSGTGSGQKRTIASNTTSQITITANWDTNPDATSGYTIRRKIFIEIDTDPPFIAQVLSISSYILTLNRMPETPTTSNNLLSANHRSFRISDVRIERDVNLIGTINAEAISYDTNNEWVMNLTGSPKIDLSLGTDINTLLGIVFAGTEWSIGWNEVSSDDIRPILLDKTSVRQACLSVGKKWEIDVVFREDKKVDFLLQSGYDTGYVLRFGKTQSELKRKTDYSKRKNTNFTYGSPSNWLNVSTGFYSTPTSITEGTFDVSVNDSKVFRIGDIVEICFDVQTGTVDSYEASTGKITDSSETWTVNEFLGGMLYMTSGDTSGQFRRVDSNTSSTITPYGAFDVDPTGDDYFVAPRTLPGAVIEDIDTATGIVTFKWKGEVLPIIPWGNIRIVLLVSQMGDLTIGKHPFYRTRVSLDSQDSGTAESGSDTTHVYDSSQSWTINRWQYAEVTVDGETVEVASNTSNTLTLAEALSSDPTTKAFTVTSYRKMLVDDASILTVADYIFIGLTDMRTGEGAYVSGISGSLVTFRDPISSFPEYGDHIELVTATSVGPTFIRRGKYVDGQQRDPYKLREDSIRNVDANIGPKVTYERVTALNVYEMNRTEYEFEKVWLGCTITVTDEGIGIDAEELRVKSIISKPFDRNGTEYSLTNVPEYMTTDEVLNAIRDRENLRSLISEEKNRFGTCINWDDDAQVCMLLNKTSSTNEGLLCLDPDLSMRDGRRISQNVGITKSDCRAYGVYQAPTLNQEKTASHGTVSTVTNDEWDLTHRFAVDTGYRVTDDSHAAVIGVYNETTSSATDLALALSQIQMSYHAPFDNATGTLTVGVLVSWDGLASLGQVYEITYYTSTTGVIGVHVFDGSAPDDNDVIVDASSNDVTVDGNSEAKVVPYNTTKKTGCYVQVKRASGSNPLKVTSYATIVGYGIGS